MKKCTKIVAVTILSVLCACFFSVGCGLQKKQSESHEVSSVFATFTDSIDFNENYTLKEDDVKATQGDNSVKISKPVTFNLNGHTLNLNGYTLDIAFDGAGVVAFQGGEGGKVENGKLNVAVPNGDIEFNSVELAESVTSDLHAASETIRFANAKIEGKSTIKSNTNVQIQYSSVENITLDGNATLSAKSGAKLGSLTVSETATNAKVEVTGSASVNSVELKAPVEATIKGAVNELKVAEKATNAKVEVASSATVKTVEVKAPIEATIKGAVATLTVTETAKSAKVEVAKTATVSSVEVKAPIEAKIQGAVTEITVAETAKAAENDAFNIEISSSATVSKLELKAAASVEIAGNVTQLNVAETAGDNANDFEIKVKEDAFVASVSLNAKTTIEVSGAIEQMVVEETAVGASVNFTETAASTIAVVVKAEDTKIESENEITVHVAESVENVELSEEITKNDVNAEEIEEIIQHVHVWLVKETIPADCTHEGKIIYRCEGCDEEKYKTLPALGHDWEYKVIEEPTETKEGKSVRTCRRCGEREEISVKALDSIAVKGLNAIAELIGDNSYTINVKGGVTASDVGSVAKVNDIQLIVNSKDGKLSGSLEVDMTVMTKESDKDGVVIGKEDILVKGKLENECLTAYVAYGDEEAWAKIPVEFLIETLAGEFFGDGYSSMLTSYFNAENFNKVEKVAKDIAEKLNDKLVLKEEVFTGIELNVLGLLFKTTADGENTVYTYDSETINAIGDMTAEELFDAVFGENAYADLKTFITESLDKTTFQAFADFVSFTAQHNLTAEDVIDVLKILQSAIPQLGDAEESLDLVDVFNTMSGKTVAEFVATKMDKETLDAIKEAIGEDKDDVDAVKALFAKLISEVDKMADAKVSDYMAKVPPKYVQMAGQIMQLVDTYNDNISFTLDKDHKLVAYEIKLATPEIDDEEKVAEMPKIDFTFSWKQGEQLVFNFDVDIMGVKVSFDDIDNGKELKVHVFNEADIDVKLLSEKDGEYEIKYDLIGENFAVEGDFALTIAEKDVNVTTTTKVEVPKSADEKRETEVDFTISGAKGAPVDELVQVEEIDYSGLQNFRLEDEEYGDKDVYELKHIVDDKGSRYELSKTKSYFSWDWKSLYEDGELKLSDDGKELYVGTYIEETVTSVLKEFNGSIDAAILAQSDCKNWYKLSFAAQGTVEKKYYPDTTFVFTDYHNSSKRIVEKGRLDEDMSEWYSSTGIKNYEFFYNPVIAKNEGKSDNAVALKSQHNFEYTYTFKGKVGVCSDGVTVTKTCTGCGMTNTYDRTYCDYEYEYVDFNTMCGEDYVRVGTCKACGGREVSYDMNDEYHTFDYDMYMEISASDLAKAGFDNAGFYYGHVKSFTCVDCELTVAMYEWYTCIGGVCKNHNAVKLTCPEHTGEDYHFDAINVVGEGSRNGHYNSSTTTYNADVSEEARSAGFDLLPAAAQEIMAGYDKIALEETKCEGCKQLQHRRYMFVVTTKIEGDDVATKVCYLDVYYSDGVLRDYGYTIYDYDKDSVTAAAAEYGIPVESDVPYALVAYYYNSGYTKPFDYYDGNFYINFPVSDVHRFVMDIYVNKAFGAKSVSASYYDFDNCQQVRYVVNVKTKTATESVSEWHPARVERYYLYEGVSCRDGIVMYEAKCKTCGKIIYSYETGIKNHSYNYMDSSDLSVYGPALTDDYNALDGLSAMVRGNLCSVCGYLSCYDMTLNDDWVLTSDVTIKADGFNIRLNGHVIDLNGHELRIYGVAGSGIIITDAGMFRSGIVDSQGGGMLVVFTNGGDIHFGSINVECEVFVSDCDDLNTIDASIADGGNNIAAYVFNGGQQNNDDPYIPEEENIEEKYRVYYEEMKKKGEEPMSFDEFVEMNYGYQGNNDEPYSEEERIKEEYNNYVEWMIENGEEFLSFEEYLEEYYGYQGNNDEPYNPDDEFGGEYPYDYDEDDLQKKYQEYKDLTDKIGVNAMSFEEFVEWYYSGNNGNGQHDSEETNYPEETDDTIFSNPDDEEHEGAYIAQDDPRMYEFYKYTVENKEAMSYDEFYKLNAGNIISGYYAYVKAMEAEGEEPLSFDEFLDMEIEELHKSMAA